MLKVSSLKVACASQDCPGILLNVTKCSAGLGWGSRRSLGYWFEVGMEQLWLRLLREVVVTLTRARPELHSAGSPVCVSHLGEL